MTESTGCWHGQAANVANISHHRDVGAPAVRKLLKNAQNNIQHLLLLHRYAQFCKDVVPTAADGRAWRTLCALEPYTLPMFGWITLERFARMKQPEAWQQFVAKYNLETDQTVRDFLTQTISKDIL